MRAFQYGSNTNAERLNSPQRLDRAAIDRGRAETVDEYPPIARRRAALLQSGNEMWLFGLFSRFAKTSPTGLRGASSSVLRLFAPGAKAPRPEPQCMDVLRAVSLGRRER